MFSKDVLIRPFENNCCKLVKGGKMKISQLDNRMNAILRVMDNSAQWLDKGEIEEV